MKISKPSIDHIGKRIIETFSEPVRPVPLEPDNSSLQSYVRKTAIKSASLSAALAVPGGVTGLITMLPEIAGIWRLQAQMVGSIANAYGYEKSLSREQMIWCMFKQFGYGVVSKYVFQKGGTYVFKQMNSQAFQGAAHLIGKRLVTQQGSKAASRIIPLAGSVASGALSYRDTQRVGKNALRLYSIGVEQE